LFAFSLKYINANLCYFVIKASHLMDFTAQQQRPHGIKMYTAGSVTTVSYFDS